MKEPKLRVSAEKHSSYKNGIRYYVFGSLPPEKAKRHGFFKTEEEAQAKLDELRRNWFSKSSLVTDEDKELALQAVTRLRKQNSNEDAKGKTIDFAVEWFIGHFKDDSEVLTIREYCKRFLELRHPEKGAQKVAPNTYKNNDHHLGKFSDCYGSRKPNEISTKDLREFCSSFATEIHPYKEVYGLYSWLSNEHTRMEKLEHPVFHGVSDSPFFYYKRPKEERSEILIATHKEVEKILKLAHEEKVLPYFFFGFFLGVRPEELRKLLSLPDVWTYIDLVKGIVVVPKEIEKTRKRSREIALKPSIKKWLKYFKEQKISLKPPEKAFIAKRRKVLRTVLEIGRAKHPDIMRHTCISHRCKVDKLIHEVCRECATSEQMIRDHYQRFVTENEARLFFRIGPEVLGG